MAIMTLRKQGPGVLGRAVPKQLKAREDVVGRARMNKFRGYGSAPEAKM